MPSPFPGMNPFLEQEDVWHDFHERLLPLAAELLGAQVLPRYIVKVDEHVYIHDPREESRRLVGRSDVHVRPNAPPASTGDAVAVLEAPARVQLPAVDVEELSFLEIRDRQSRQLITVIELLSPANKRSGDNRQQYLLKRSQLLASSVNFVEIDLLRGWGRMPMQKAPVCDYCVLVSRAAERPEAGIWPIGLREALPPIPIPLREGEEARLELQTAIHRVYDAAGYGYYMYEAQPEPPLSAEDAAWARQFLPGAPA